MGKSVGELRICLAEDSPARARKGPSKQCSLDTLGAVDSPTNSALGKKEDESEVQSQP